MNDYTEQIAGKTFDQRAQERAKRAASERIAEIRAAERPPQTYQEQTLSAAETRVAELKQRLTHCLPAERAGIRARIKALQTSATRIESELREQDRIGKLEADPRTRLAREHAESFVRTPPPGADADSVAYVAALARSDKWRDGDELAAEYWAAVETLESEAAARAISETAAKAEAAAKAGLEHSRAELEQVRREAAANHARNMGASDAE